MGTKRLTALVASALLLALPLLAQTPIRGSRVIEGTVNYCEDAGATDSYACNLSPAISAYVTGAEYCFKANTANVGAASLALNGLAATTIVKMHGGVATTLADNDIRVGQRVCVIYDGTNMQMTSQVGNAPGGGSPGGSDTQVQFNDSGTFGGDSDFTWNKTSNILTLSNVGRLEVSGPVGDLRLIDSNAGANIKRWAIRSEATADAKLRFGLINDAESAWVAQDVLTIGRASDGNYLQPGSSNSDVVWAPNPVSSTCTDNGTGTPGALTLNPAGRLIHLTVADADGCTVTLSEASTRNGRISTIINISANTATFSDTATVSELSGAIVLGQWDVLNITYVTDRWVQMSVSDN